VIVGAGGEKPKEAAGMSLSVPRWVSFSVRPRLVGGVCSDLLN
jgi:hypothetical protein